MKIIPLTQGRFTLVDADDYNWLRKYYWHYSRGTRKTGYATCTTSHMHQLILDHHQLRVENLSIDHKNGWGLDNRKTNLRMVTTAENNTNQDTKRAIRQRSSGKWESRIGRTYIGQFDTQREALEARANAEREKGWLTVFERQELRQNLLEELDQLVKSGDLLPGQGGTKLEDFFVCPKPSFAKQRIEDNQAIRSIEQRVKEFFNIHEQVRREADKAEWKAASPTRRKAAMERLRQANRLLYFHSRLGWRVRLPDGEISVPNRQAGQLLMDIYHLNSNN